MVHSKVLTLKDRSGAAPFQGGGLFLFFFLVEQTSVCDCPAGANLLFRNFFEGGESRPPDARRLKSTPPKPDARSWIFFPSLRAKRGNLSPGSADFSLRFSSSVDFSLRLPRRGKSSSISGSAFDKTLSFQKCMLFITL